MIKVILIIAAVLLAAYVIIAVNTHDLTWVKVFWVDRFLRNVLIMAIGLVVFFVTLLYQEIQ